ncbi:MAG: hypothetical protein N2314_08620 [Brevinematales bacterium]|nr:hypothetical protein [Brevinematales bacterium]
MTQKQQTQFTLLLVIFNGIFWPFIFFPQFQKFLHTFERDISTTRQVVPRQRTSSGMTQRIEYESLRNIFEYATEQTSPAPIPQKNRFSSASSPVSPSPPPPRGVSLQLRSVLTLQGRMIATLQDPMVPERMFTVVKGDMVDGYRVIEVTGDAVILERQGEQIRLTLE